jgi:cytochrome c-type biogenesis protein CcmH/NrfG
VANRLLYQAEVRFAVAFDLKPDEIDILGSWGLAIILQAESATKPDAPSLWRAGSAKFAELLQKDPKRADAWGYWGVCLYHQATHCADEQEENDLLQSATRKFDIAIQLAPQSSYSWRWRG